MSAWGAWGGTEHGGASADVRGFGKQAEHISGQAGATDSDGVPAHVAGSGGQNARIVDQQPASADGAAPDQDRVHQQVKRRQSASGARAGTEQEREEEKRERLSVKDLYSRQQSQFKKVLQIQ